MGIVRYMEVNSRSRRLRRRLAASFSGTPGLSVEGAGKRGAVRLPGLEL